MPERLPFFIYLDQAGSPSLELVIVCSSQLKRGCKPTTHRVGVKLAAHLIPTLGQPATKDSLTVGQQLTTRSAVRTLGKIVLRQRVVLFIRSLEGEDRILFFRLCNQKRQDKERNIPIHIFRLGDIQSPTRGFYLGLRGKNLWDYIRPIWNLLDVFLLDMGDNCFHRGVFAPNNQFFVKHKRTRLEVIAEISRLAHKVNPWDQKVGGFKLSVYSSIAVGNRRSFALSHCQRFVLVCFH